MKKVLSLLLVVAAVFTLAACGPKEENIEGQKVTVAIWGGNEGEMAGIDALEAGFEAATGADVEFVIYGAYTDDLMINIQADNAPDVFYLDAFVLETFVSQGIVNELDKDEFEASEFNSNLVDTFSVDGSLYAIPKDYSTLAMYVNEEMAQVCGISQSQVDELKAASLEELIGLNGEDALIEPIYEQLAVCDAEWNGLVVKEVIKTGLTFNVDLARNLMYATKDDASVTKDVDGLSMSNVDDQAVIDNLTPFFDKLAEDQDYFKIVPDTGAGWNGDAMTKGATFLAIEGNWVLGHLRSVLGSADSFSTVEVPMYKGSNNAMMFTVGYAIYSGTENLAVAEAFVKYAGSNEGQKLWAEKAGVIPGRDETANELGVSTDELLMAHYEAAAYANPWQAGPNLSTIADEYRNQLGAFFTPDNTLTVAELLEQAAANANHTIDSAN